MWEPQVAPLARSYRVITPDLRGYGESPATPDRVLMREFADDIETLLDGLDVETAAVIGLSMGGLITMELAIGSPERWWAIGLVATTAQPVTDTEREARLAMAALIDAEGMEPQVEAMLPRLFGPTCPAEVIDGIAAMMRASDPVGAAAALRGRAARPDYRPGLASLAIPSFVCAGTEDTWSTAAVVEEIVRSLRDPHLLMLDGVAHLPNLEATDVFNRALLEFLAAARGSSA